MRGRSHMLCTQHAASMRLHFFSASTVTFPHILTLQRELGGVVGAFCDEKDMGM